MFVRTLGLALLALPFAAAAHAETGQTTWTTYLYEGPGLHYTVVDEVPQATKLDDVRCANGWCEVRFSARTGYIVSEVMALNGASLSNPGPGVLANPGADLIDDPKGPCVAANMTGGNGGNSPSLYCQK